ncbi:unnamed protein product [Phaedon cochleariae]|uniref:Uncharacterized protein n=1 Tax=Phaedon cochleariae TaxID=80249 RepID=A0A9P0DR56_PHACE|nr:unnamed protein product [Phaedon cochleariae]
MKSSTDLHHSKSDVQAISSRRSTRSRNVISDDTTSPTSSSNKLSNLRSQVNIEKIKQIASDPLDIGHHFDDSHKDAKCGDCKQTVDPVHNTSVHEEPKFKKNISKMDSSYTFPEKSILQPEDVTKVFKILSKPNTLEQSDLKSGRSVLKTYCKQMNSSSNSQVIESFGLPDNPIVSQNEMLTSTIDIESIDASEITLLDVELSHEPWEFPNISGEHLLSNLEEIRFKEHPQKLHIFETFSDNLRDHDLEEHEYVFTSTPRVRSSHGPKKDRSVNIDFLKSSLRKVLNEKIYDQVESSKTVGSKRSKTNLVHYNSLDHENEEVEIFNTSRIRPSSVSPIKNKKPNKLNKFKSVDKIHPNNEETSKSDSTKGADGTDKEVDIISHKKNGQYSSQSKKLLRSLDIGMEFKLEEPFESPRRVLRSKSCLDIFQENICINLPPKQNSRSSTKKWLSVSQDNVSNGMKNDGIKEKLLSKSLPQLKVVLSPIDASLAVKDSLHSDTGMTKINSTRKSLRSYNVPDKIHSDDNSYTELVSSSPSKHCNISETWIQSIRNLECLGIASKPGPHPQIFDDNSSLDTIISVKVNYDTKDSIESTKPQSNEDQVSNSCEMFQEFVNHTELNKNGLSKNHMKLCQDLLKKKHSLSHGVEAITVNEKILDKLRKENSTVDIQAYLKTTKQTRLNSKMIIDEIDEASIKLQTSESILQTLLSGEQNIVDEKSHLNVSEMNNSNNESHITIHKTDFPENSVNSCERKQETVIDNSQADIDYKFDQIESSFENVENRTLKPIPTEKSTLSTKQKRGRGRPRKQIPTIENPISTADSENSFQKVQKGLISSGIKSSSHVENDINNHVPADTKCVRKSSRQNKLVVEDKIPLKKQYSLDNKKNEKSDESKLSSTNITRAAQTIYELEKKTNIETNLCTSKSSSKTIYRTKDGKYCRKNESHLDEYLMNESSILSTRRTRNTEEFYAKIKRDEDTNMKDISSTQFVINNELLVFSSGDTKSPDNEFSRTKNPENFKKSVESEILSTMNHVTETHRRSHGIPSGRPRGRPTGRPTGRPPGRPRGRPVRPSSRPSGRPRGRPRKIIPVDSGENKILYKNDSTTSDEQANVSLSGAEEGISLTEISLKSLFNSQNTIADLVKKRCRSLKNYKLSRSKSIGKKPAPEDHEVSQKFEDSIEALTDTSVLSSETSVDSSDINKTQENHGSLGCREILETDKEQDNPKQIEVNQSAMPDYAIEKEETNRSIQGKSVQEENEGGHIKVEVQSNKKNIDTIECEKKILETSETIEKGTSYCWKEVHDSERSTDKNFRTQDERPNNPVSVPQEKRVEDIRNKKVADTSRMHNEQTQDLEMLETCNYKIVSSQNYLNVKNGTKDTTVKKINGKENNNVGQEISYPCYNSLVNNFNEKSYFNTNMKTSNFIVGNGDEKEIEIGDKNNSSRDYMGEKDLAQKENHQGIEDNSIPTSDITENHIENECPNQLRRMINMDDDDDDIKYKSNLEHYLNNECPNLLKRIDMDDEDMKDKTNLKGITETAQSDQEGEIAENCEYDTECEDDMIVEPTFDKSSHKLILRSKTSLGDKMKRNDLKDATPTQRSKHRRSSLDQVLTDVDNIEELKGCRSIETSLRFSNKVRILDPDAVKDIRGNVLRFKVGSIAWAKIGSYPFWPCLVTEEPSTGIYVKNISSRFVPRVCYHVIFFGDNCRRAWISKHKMMVYTNRGDLYAIHNHLKKENKSCKYLQFYSVSIRYLNRWILAVDEAEKVKLKPEEERLSFFKSLTIENEIITIKDEDSPVRKRTRSSQTLASDIDKATTNQDSPVKKKQKKSESELNLRKNHVKNIHESSELDLQDKTKCTKMKDVVELPNSIDESAAKRKNRLCKAQIKDPFPSTSAASSTEKKVPAKKIERVNKASSVGVITSVHEDSVTSINQELVTAIDDLQKLDDMENEPHNLSTFFCESMEAQHALFKRNNLFKGVLKEKVCQYCFMSGDVLKCKGCNAVYHAGCAIGVLQELMIPKRKNRLSYLKDENLVDENKIKVEVEDKELHIKENKVESDDDDHVQIITVASSVYNTPPRKTFPPNFENLSLGEQIDFKMKEVMKKFESKTTYAESPTDTSSEDNNSVDQLPRTESNSKSHIEFPPIIKDKRRSLDNFQGFSKPLEMDSSIKPTKTIRHVTADLSSEHTGSSESEDLLDKPSSSVIHVTADSLTTFNGAAKESGPNSVKNMRNKVEKTQKLVTKHVTADCGSFETVDSENSNSNFSHLTKQSETSETTDSAKSMNPKHFKCGFCIEQMDPYCFVCHQAVSIKGSGIRHKCSLYQCSRFYHPECLKLWPQTQWSLIQTTKNRYSQEEIDSFVCPQHVCHTCVSDDPRAATSRCSGDKIVKCQRCPSTYHSTSLCVPAGTEILSSTQIICPRHRDKSKMYTINTTWCFLCSEGGALICCETCPTSVHPECMPQVNLTEDEKFICEECESGRLPLYDEIIWVKLGKYRWWPGLILFPNEIPVRVVNMKHNVGEFVVKFFGTYDHYWVNRGRSFLFQEGDTGDSGSRVSIKKKVEQAAFKKAVDEAVVVHKLKKEFKLKMEGESLNSQKPPPYIKIKVNKPVGNVRYMELDLSNTTACDCNPRKRNPCGPDSDCLNRLLLTECNPEACPAGKSCKNQSFEKRDYPPMIPYKTQGRGWGLKCLAAIKRGQFVIEYVGEIIDDEEYQRRIQKMHQQKEENYYFLTIDQNRMIDAGPKGNMARFMNHCCQPNCETQKWTVNGDTKVGLFATKDIPANTELTFNYNLECTGTEKKICRCGAPNCSGFIGAKAKQDTELKKPKKTYKKKEPVKPLALPPCFICKRRGDVGACNNKMCNKAYHLKCLNLTEWPEGSKFACPWHNCNTCSKRTIRCCVKCLNSFCPTHSEGNVRYDNLLGFVCNYHDPSKPGNEKISSRKKHKVINDEMAVSSTTQDDFLYTDSDDIPLSHRFPEKNNNKNGSSDSDEFELYRFRAVPVKHRYRRRKMKKMNTSDTDDDDVSLANSSSYVPLRKMEEENDHSQDETVSSATASDFEEEMLRKRKRRKSKKNARGRKRTKFHSSSDPSVTANNHDLNNVNSDFSKHAMDSNRL